MALALGQSMEEAIDRMGFTHPDTGAIIKALLTGDRGNIPKTVTEAFRNSGASHILALSGLHLGIIYTIVSKAFALIGNSPLAKRTRSVAIILLCGTYTMATGAGASISRAFLFIFLGRTITKMKKGDTLIVSEVSRLSRNLTDIMTIMGTCLKKGINIYTTKEQYRFDDTLNSKILCFAFGLVAEIERNLISLRTKEALALRKSEGITLGRPKGSSPKLQILIDNDEKIRKMLASGHTIRSICRKMKVSKDTWYRYQKLLESTE